MSTLSIAADNSLAPARRPWKAAIAWLALLGPMFFISYGLANGYASRLSDVPSFVFGWEKHLPFMAWTIVPYMSIDLFYAASLFLCADRLELRAHALRLLMATAISVVFFVLFPLRFSFERPPTHGVYGWLFGVLTGFDKPFNQAPSLHISLLMILWVRYNRHTQGMLRYALHIWFALIGVSVLTTFQHHFIDILTGAIVGVVCLYAIPDARQARRLPGPAPSPEAKAGRRRLSRRYALLALILTALAAGLAATDGPAEPIAWLLLWPAVSVLLVAGAYAGLGVEVFQKRDGRVAWPARWILAPYQWAAWFSSRCYTRRGEPYAQAYPGVWIGRAPSRCDLRQGGFAAIVDLAAEFPAHPQARCLHYQQVSLLDLAIPTTAELALAAAAIERARASGKTLVHCALGYSRSALAIAAWRIDGGDTAAAALACIRGARPQLVVAQAGIDLLAAYQQEQALRQGAPDALVSLQRLP
jgi:protein-tyrosine phosphatase/membrane-associated phospholipid phosphatase